MNQARLIDPKRLVSLKVREDGVWDVVMADKVAKNAFGEAFVSELEEVLAYVCQDRTVKVVVLRGLSEVFAAGAPRELLQRLARGDVVPTDIALSKAMLDVPVPTIAAMEGHVTGGGLALGLCADIVVMARESR